MKFHLTKTNKNEVFTNLNTILEVSFMLKGIKSEQKASKSKLS